MKFGGSTVGTIAGLTQVLSIVLTERERWDRLLVVVSALDGVTDMLIEAGSLAQMGNRRGYRRIVANLRTRHMALLEHLPLGAAERGALQADIDRLWFDLLDVCQSLSDEASGVILPPSVISSLDSVVGVGERLAARIVAALLRQNNLRGVAIDATDVLITDNVFGNATPDIERTRARVAANLVPMLDRRIIPVITGYIGATRDGKPTTLGRGGSDYSASVIGMSVAADELWIWTDVDGMMSADPNEIGGARVIPFLSYDEVSELAYFGARILHPRMIAPLREHQIPVRVRNVFKPQQPGTLIQQGSVAEARESTTDAQRGVLKAVTAIQGISFAAPMRGSLASLMVFVDETLWTVTRTRAEVLIAAQSSEQSFICVVVPTTAGLDASHGLRVEMGDRLRLRDDLHGWTVDAVSVITVIGAQVGERSDVTATILRALGDIHVLGIAHGASHVSMSVVVESDDSDAALAALHELVVSRP